MSVRPIRLLGDPVLRNGSAEVVDFDRQLRRLVRDLWDTMESSGGAGLAAPSWASRS
nr:peptide deformylase [Actinopolyspora erythraea]